MKQSSDILFFFSKQFLRTIKCVVFVCAVGTQFFIVGLRPTPTKGIQFFIVGLRPTPTKGTQ